MDEARIQRLKVVLFFICLAPFVALIAGALLDALGSDPVKTLTHQTGIWALRLLLFTLAMGPLVRYTKWFVVMRFRRLIALFCFFYASLHLVVYLVFEHALVPAAIARDIVRHPYVLAGMTAYLCLLPLAITSTDTMMRRMRGAWKRLHRLVYLAGAAATLHFLWQMKAQHLTPLGYAAIFFLLMAVRLPDWIRRPPPAPGGAGKAPPG
jgi:sulfoxide reductase heme-binding subunit YedZ